MASEIWKPVVGYEGLYEVSDHGRVRRYGRIVGGYLPKSGYPQIRLSKANNPKTSNIHRLVCEAFHGPPPSPEHEVAHLDGARTNNRADNLKWKTVAENAADRKVHGTERMGEEIAHLAKLTAEKVREIRAKHSPPIVGYGCLAREYGVSRTAIMQIIKRRHWKHI